VVVNNNLKSLYVKMSWMSRLADGKIFSVILLKNRYVMVGLEVSELQIAVSQRGETLSPTRCFQDSEFLYLPPLTQHDAVSPCVMRLLTSIFRAQVRVVGRSNSAASGASFGHRDALVNKDSSSLTFDT
jgi:hypothetical protein